MKQSAFLTQLLKGHEDLWKAKPFNHKIECLVLNSKCKYLTSEKSVLIIIITHIMCIKVYLQKIMGCLDYGFFCCCLFYFILFFVDCYKNYNVFTMVKALANNFTEISFIH